METSAGLLLYQRTLDIQVFLGHFGGPYGQIKDEDAWTIPKGRGTLQNVLNESARTDVSVGLRTA